MALAITALVAAGAAWPTPALAHLAGAGGADTLAHPRAYVALAPLCDVFDALSLLTVRQHAAVMAWAGLAFVAVRARRGLRRPRSGPLDARACLRAAGRELGAGALALAVLFATYATALLAPRPMAALSLGSVDELAVDIHSHTSASHDGRPGFDAETNRRWHAASGFAAAYVTDHRSYAGAEAGARGNPARAGLGTVLLPGIETRTEHDHVLVLGVAARDGVDRQSHLDEAPFAAARARGGAPLVVLAAPASLGAPPSGVPFDGVEIADGAPRGIAFTSVHGAALRALAARSGATLVAGSDLHGWGRTAAAWTVVRLPGWRALAPDALDTALRGALRRPGDVRVVARTVIPPPLTAADWISTPPRVAWLMFAAASPPQRWSWIAWAWAGCAAVVLRRRRRSRRAVAEATRAAA